MLPAASATTGLDDSERVRRRGAVVAAAGARERPAAGRFGRSHAGPGRRPRAVGTALGRHLALRQRSGLRRSGGAVRGPRHVAPRRRLARGLPRARGGPAARLRLSERAGRLYVAGSDGGFRLRSDAVGAEPSDPLWPPVSVTSQGVFTQETVPCCATCSACGRTSSSRPRATRASWPPRATWGSPPPTAR